MRECNCQRGRYSNFLTLAVIDRSATRFGRSILARNRNPSILCPRMPTCGDEMAVTRPSPHLHNPRHDPKRKNPSAFQFLQWTMRPYRGTFTSRSLYVCGSHILLTPLLCYPRPLRSFLAFLAMRAAIVLSVFLAPPLVCVRIWLRFPPILAGDDPRCSTRPKHPLVAPALPFCPGVAFADDFRVVAGARLGR